MTAPAPSVMAQHCSSVKGVEIILDPKDFFNSNLSLFPRIGIIRCMPDDS